MAIVKITQRVEYEVETELDTDKLTGTEKLAFIKRYGPPSQLDRILASREMSSEMFKLEKLVALAIEQSQVDPLDL